MFSFIKDGSFKKSITGFFALVYIVFEVLSGVSIYAQNTSISSLPVTFVNTSIRPDDQCLDGTQTTQVPKFRMYTNDVRYPDDEYYKTAGSSNNNFITVFDLPSTTVTFNDFGNNSFQALGNFIIKSWGSPVGTNSVLVGKIDAGLKATSSHPTSTTSIAGQLIYKIKRRQYLTNPSTNSWAGTYTTVNPYQYRLYNNQSIVQTTPTYTNAYTQDSYVKEGYECVNYYRSRCGDGYIDSPSSNSHIVPLPNDSLANESCDPGANISSYTDDIMPNGVTPTATYNCTSTCVINNVPQPPILVYTKMVRNVTTNSNNGQFVEADTQGAAVVIRTGDIVQYQITITKTGGPVTNTILSDVLPTNNGFLLSAYSINSGSQISTTSFPATNITSLLNVGPVTVTLYGVVGSPTATAFVNTATLTENGIAAGTLSPGSNVAWTVLENITPPKPDVSIKKEVEVSPSSNTRQELSTVTPGQTVRFKITYRNISSVNALNALVTDTLPAGLTCVSAVHQDGASIPCVANGISWTEPVMNPGVEKYIIFTANVSASISSSVTTNTANIQLPGGSVKSDPAQVQPQSITDFIVTKKILSGSVIPGTIIKYEIGFKNTGNAPISSYILNDPLQNSTYVAGSSKLNGNISITPSYIGNTLIRGCNSTNTALNGQTVCPLQPGVSGTIIFDVLVN